MEHDYSGSLAGKKETLRHICSALSKQYKVPIELDDLAEGANTHGKNTKITLGTKNLAFYGLDYHIGLVLHEVAHIRYSPALSADIEWGVKLMLNLVEDERIEQIMRDEYAGGGYFLDELHRPSFEELERQLEKPSTVIRENLAEHSISQVIDEDNISAQYGLNEEGNDDEKIGDIVFERKSELFRRIVGLAYLNVAGLATSRTDTGHPEANERATKLSRLMYRARYAKEKDIIGLATQCYELLKDIIPVEPETPPYSLETVARLTAGADAGDFGERQTVDTIFTVQDAEARPLVDRLKRKLVVKLRENERQRFVAGKRKGLLNKRSLRRVALNNFRVYKKRQDIKGQNYTVEIAVDTSGSMFSRERPTDKKTRIELVQYCTALLARTFRGIGFPTGVTYFGDSARNILHSKDRFSVDKIQANIDALDGNIYGGGTYLYETIQYCEKLLDKGRKDTKKLLVIFTDGGVMGTQQLREQIKVLEKKGTSVLIFYMDLPKEYQNRANLILGDTKKERFVKSSTELIPACVELAESLVV